VTRSNPTILSLVAHLYLVQNFVNVDSLSVTGHRNFCHATAPTTRST
jgi:hypothetical protein